MDREAGSAAPASAARAVAVVGGDLIGALDEHHQSRRLVSGVGQTREIGMDAWGWEQLRPWLTARVELPVGPLFCVIDGPTRGRPWSSAAVRSELRRLAVQAGVRRRFAPHQLRHAHAVELAR